MIIKISYLNIGIAISVLYLIISTLIARINYRKSIKNKLKIKANAQQKKLNLTSPPKVTTLTVAEINSAFSESILLFFFWPLAAITIGWTFLIFFGFSSIIKIIEFILFKCIALPLDFIFTLLITGGNVKVEIDKPIKAKAIEPVEKYFYSYKFTCSVCGETKTYTKHSNLAGTNRIVCKECFQHPRSNCALANIKECKGCKCGFYSAKEYCDMCENQSLKVVENENNL